MRTFKELKSTRLNKNLKKQNLKFHNHCKKKKVALTTKEQMDAKIAKKQEKRKLKKQALEVKLSKSTDEMNKLKEFAKKTKNNIK